MGTLAKSEDPYEMLLFIRVCTVCLDKNYLQRKKIKTILFGNYNLCPLIYIMDYPKFMVSTQKEESNSAGRGLILN